MKVLPHQYHLSAELRNKLSITHQKLGATPSFSTKRKYNAESSFKTRLQLPSTPQAGNYKTPLTVHNSSVPTTYLPIESTEPTVTVRDLGGPEKTEAKAILIDKWPQPTECRSWKISFKSEVSHSSPILHDPKNIAELIPASSFLKFESCK